MGKDKEDRPCSMCGGTGAVEVLNVTRNWKEWKLVTCLQCKGSGKE